MKFVCDRAEMNDALQMIVGVVDPRHVKELLQSVRLQACKDALIFCATDLEIGMRCTITDAEVKEPGEMILPADRLAGIVRESRDEKLSLDSENATCVINGTDSLYHVLGDLSEEYPDIPEFPADGAIEVEGAVLREMLQKTVFAAAAEKMRYALNGLLLVTKENSPRLEMVATDGRRLAWIQRKANKKCSQNAEVIIPTKGALQLQHMVGETEMVKLQLAERHLFAMTAQAELVAQLVDGKFPNYRDVIPKDMDKKFEIQASVFASAMRRAALLSDRDDDSRGVNMDLSPGKMILTSSAPDRGDAKVEVGIEYDDDPVAIALNPDFVLDGLKALGESVVRVEIRDGNTPCLIKQGNDYVYLTMPIT